MNFEKRVKLWAITGILQTLNNLEITPQISYEDLLKINLESLAEYQEIVGVTDDDELRQITESDAQAILVQLVNEVLNKELN